MQQNTTGTMSFAVTAALFEGALVILALCLGWALDRPPLATFHFNASGMSLGLVATLPLLGFFWFCMKSKWRAFVRILHVLDETFIPLFRQCGLIELGVIALLAGLGEEMLFRDIVQGWLADKIGGFYGAAIGLGVAAMIFGLLHCITRLMPCWPGASVCISAQSGWPPEICLCPSSAMHCTTFWRCCIWCISVNPTMSPMPDRLKMAAVNRWNKHFVRFNSDHSWNYTSPKRKRGREAVCPRLRFGLVFHAILPLALRASVMFKMV